MSEQASLRHLLQVKITDGPHESPEFLDEGIPFLSVDNIIDGRIDFATCRYISESEHARFSKKAKPRRGDVLLTKAASVGRAACVDTDVEFNVWSPIAIIRPRPDLLFDRFLFYVLNGSDAQAQLVRGSTSNTQQNIAMGDIAAIKLKLPALAQQRAIADYLDTETARIDALITKKRHLIELLEERWITRRRQVMLGTLDPVSGVGDRPDGSWDQLGLGVLIELQRGHDLPTDEREPGAVPIVSSGGISGYHSVAAAKGPGVITGRYGTIGEVFYVECDYWPLNTTLYVKDFRSNHPEWVCHLLAALPLDAEKDKSAVTGINRNVIGQLRVPRPPLNEQQRIAELLNSEYRAARHAISSIERQLGLLVEHRQALITAAVTGELKIPATAA